MATLTGVYPGTTQIKALKAEGRVGGYLVVWGDAKNRDLQGEYFTPQTDLALDWFKVRPALYHHGLDGNLKAASIGVIDTLKADDTGLWAEAQLDLHKKYVETVNQLVEKGILHWSSGSLAHLVEVEEDGQIKRWPLIEGSMTPTPAEPRNTNIASIKSAYQELGLDIEQLTSAKGIKSTEVSNPIEATIRYVDRQYKHSMEVNKMAKTPVKQEETPDDEETAYMTVAQAKEMIAQEVKNALAMMGDEEEMKQVGEDDLEEQVVADVMEEVLTDEEEAKSIVPAKFRRSVRKAIIEVIPGILEKTLNERTQFEASIKAVQHKVRQKAALQLDATSSAGYGDQSPAIPRMTLKTPYEQAGWQAEDYSFALGLHSVKGMQTHISDEKFYRGMADEALKAYDQNKLKLNPAQFGAMKAIKANEVMHSTQDAFGDENVPTIWSDTIWDKPRVDAVIPNVIQNIEMPSNPYEYPVESSDPTVSYIAETTTNASLSLDATAPAIPQTKIGTAKVTFTARKFGLNINISAELDEDGLVRLIPQYRAQAEKAVVESEDFVAFNGDTSTTTNINSDGETITATTRNYLAYDGLIHQALVVSTAKKLDAGGVSPTMAALRSTRALLGSQIKGFPGNLCWVVDPSTYVALLSIDAVQTVDKYGEQATVLRGELGRIDGIRVFLTDQMFLADADGKVTQTSNVVDRGRALLFHTPSWLIGYRRRISQSITFVPYYDAHVLVLTVRNHLVGRTMSDGSQQATDDTVAILYNIGV